MLKGEVSRSRAYRIVDRGLTFVSSMVSPHIGLKDLVDELGLKWSNYLEPNGTVPWGDWRLVLDGEEYEPLFPTIEAWAEYYEVDLSTVDVEKYR